jgi:bacteriorhodopsin
MRMGSRGHQARAACAAPLPALLPTPEGLGQRHAHGVNGVYTILGFFFFYFFSFYFLFLWGSKNGLQHMDVSRFIPMIVEDELL